MYVCQLSLLQLLIWAGYRHFKERLPEAICCCLQTCNVDVLLLVMYCMYIPAFIGTSADISQLWVYLCYSLIYCLRLFVVVYKLVMLSPSFLYHPYIPSFKSKDFSFTCILSTTLLSDRDGNGT